MKKINGDQQKEKRDSRFTCNGVCKGERRVTKEKLVWRVDELALEGDCSTS